MSEAKRSARLLRFAPFVVVVGLLLYAVARLKSEGALTVEGDWLRLSRDGLLEVDRLVHEFFLPEHRTARYA